MQTESGRRDARVGRVVYADAVLAPRHLNRVRRQHSAYLDLQAHLLTLAFLHHGRQLLDQLRAWLSRLLSVRRRSYRFAPHVWTRRLFDNRLRLLLLLLMLSYLELVRGHDELLFGKIDERFDGRTSCFLHHIVLVVTAVLLRGLEARVQVVLALDGPQRHRGELARLGRVNRAHGPEALSQRLDRLVRVVELVRLVPTRRLDHVLGRRSMEPTLLGLLLERLGARAARAQHHLTPTRRRTARLERR